MLSTAACLQPTSAAARLSQGKRQCGPCLTTHPARRHPMLLQILAANVEDVGPDVIEAVSQLEPAVRLAAWCGS